MKRFFTMTIFLLSMLIFVGCATGVDGEVQGQNENNMEVIINVDEDENIETVEETTHRTVTDMAGREVEIPVNIDRVYGVNNNATYQLYTLVPDKMFCWNVELDDFSKQFILDEYEDLPVLGVLYGNASFADPEEVLRYNPEIVLLSDREAGNKQIEAADNLEHILGIPVIVVEANIHNYDEVYIFLGEIFNVEERAEKLADYHRDTYDYVVERANLVEEKTRVYYARQQDGLSTDFAQSYHTEVLELVGGENVATAENGESSQSGKVTIEQVMQWNPDVIITGQMGSTKENTRDNIYADPLWQNINAVKNEKIYAMPDAPFNWFDRPPSVNRIIGMKYLGSLLYPEIYTIDIEEEIVEFFNLFYHYELNDEELAEFMSINH